MDVQRPKVQPECLLLLDANVLEVLVAEDDHAALGDQQRQLVFLEAVELAELQPADLGTDDGRELGHLEGGVLGRQKIWLVFVGDEAAVIEFKWLQRREGSLLVVNGEVGGVFVL